MGIVLKFGDDGFEVHIAVQWQRMWMFIRNALLLVWSVLSLLAALRASGVDGQFFGW